MEIKKIRQYSLVEVIGEGINGTVYRGWDSQQDRPVAIKVIRPRGGDNEIRTSRPKLDALVGLEHPNLVSISEIGEENGQFFIVSELVSGQSLQQLLIDSPDQRFDFLGISIQICRGLEFLHDKGFVHGNLRPTNIMVADDGTVKLMDAGLSLFDDKYSDSGSSHPYEPLHYLSPEHFGEEPIDFRSDHFTLGTIFFRCATGKLPFTASSEEMLIDTIVHEDPDFGELKVSGIPGDCVLLVEKLLAKNPDDRFIDTEHLKVTVSEMVSFENEIAVRGDHRTSSKDPRKLLVFSALAVVLVILWYIVSTVGK